MQTTQVNPVLTGSILPTFFYYALPSVAGLVAITTANLVDGIFVGHAIGPEALASITLQIPYFTFLFALSLMLAIGGSVIAGKYIGENNTTAASAIFSKALLVAVIANIIIALLSTIFESALYALLNVPASIIHLVDEYFNIIRWVMILQLFTMVLYYFIRMDGHPLLATWALVIGSATNIILDAWFIIYLQWGLSGAAYATAIAQLVEMAILAMYFCSPKKTLVFSWLQQQWSEIVSALYIGLSEFVNEMSVGLIFLLLNWMLISRLGVDGVAAFTIVNYFIFLSLMLSYGIADALHLLVSQNYGAKNTIRVKSFLITALCCVIALGCILIIILLYWQQFIFSWFVDKDNVAMIQLTTSLLFIIWPLFLVNGTNIILSAYLTAMHQPGASAMIAISRSLILPAMFLSVFYFLLQDSRIATDLLSDWSFLIGLPLAEWCTFFFAVFLCFRYRHLLSH